MMKEQKFFEKELDALETRVEIFANRHGKKTNTPGLSNEQQDLTDAAIEGIISRANDQKGTDDSRKLQVFAGSKRFRAVKTKILLEMPELVEELRPAKSIEEIREVMKKHANFGTKFYTTDKLDFNERGPMGAESDIAYSAGEYLQYMVDKSDQRAIDLKDKVSSSYTIQAGNIAELVAKYAQVGNNFNRIVADKSAADKQEYEKYNNKLERHFGTHQGVVECFVAKVLEKKLGEAAKKEFVNFYAKTGGFKELEGVRIEIINRGSAQKANLFYQIDGNEKSVEIDPELLQEIIGEKKAFIEKINKLSSEGEKS